MCARSETDDARESTPIFASVSSSASSPRSETTVPAPMSNFVVGDERARRHDVQRELRVADLDRVPGVVAAAEPRDDAVVAREQIDDAAFALVAPLDAEHDVDAAGADRARAGTNVHGLVAAEVEIGRRADRQRRRRR